MCGCGARAQHNEERRARAAKTPTSARFRWSQLNNMQPASRPQLASAQHGASEQQQQQHRHTAATAAEAAAEATRIWLGCVSVASTCTYTKAHNTHAQRAPTQHSTHTHKHILQFIIVGHGSVLLALWRCCCRFCWCSAAAAAAFAHLLTYSTYTSSY